MSEGHGLGSMPPFPEFYRAINNRPPFPWQARLANQVERDEKWPVEVGVPTGLGKTACLDISIWWLASQAHRLPEERTAPTRIWWLVNRRLLVDSTAEHARAIRKALVDPQAAGINGDAVQVMHAVAGRLRALAADRNSDPLEVIRLRGGVQSRVPADPSRPAVLLSTLPMFGSRLLFRGYGSSRSMRPIDAALSGMDSLILVDEAHLAKHLIRLVPDLAECTRDAQPMLGGTRSRPQVVALTATGDASARDRFDLDAEDEADPTVLQRLDAAKSIRVQTVARDAAKGMVQETRSLLKHAASPATCIVFANTPATARAVYDQLSSRRSKDFDHPFDIVMLTGRTREREAERTRRRVLDPVNGMPASRDPGAPRDRHLIVVATQTLEVGADIDAEYLVTETCGVRALTQRLGRLNRLGQFEHAESVYVHAPARKRKGQPAGTAPEWPVYGTEPARVLKRLENAMDGAGAVKVSPRNVAEVLGEPGDNPGRAPEILPGLLWEWVKTTTPPEGEAPVELYFSGISGADYAVSLIWRAHVPEPGARLWPRASDREAIAVPICEVRQALESDGELRRIASDGVTIETVAPGAIRPGDVLVLAINRGLLDEFGWNPNSSLPVVDMSIQTHGVPLHAEALKRLCGVAIGDLVNMALGIVADDEDIDETDRADAVREIVETLATATAFGWDEAEWNEVLANTRPQVISAAHEVPRLALQTPMDTGERSDELDETSLAASAVELEAHGVAVGARARLIAERIGISHELVGILDLAGLLHDMGKAEPRFQRWLDPRARSPRLLAKSSTPRHRWAATRKAAGWPGGGRHEDLSARLVRHWMETHDHGLNPLLADLLIHLVISHHGSGRPLVPPVEDNTFGMVAAIIRGHVVEVSANLARIDWEQPSRFRRLHDELGPWGLALLEAIVRRSDHAVSAGPTRRARTYRPPTIVRQSNHAVSAGALAASREDH